MYKHPILCIFFVIAVLLTVYQTIRGWMLQMLISGKNEATKGFTKRQRVWLLCLADAFTYFLCAATGSLSLFAFMHLTRSGFASTDGHAVFLIFLILYGVAGMTGKLPEILGKLKLG